MGGLHEVGLLILSGTWRLLCYGRAARFVFLALLVLTVLGGCGYLAFYTFY
jgi:hypothetical protein